MDSPCRTPCQCACERHLKVLRLLPRQAVIPSSRPHCQLAIHIDQIRAVTTNQNTADGLEAPAQGLQTTPHFTVFIQNPCPPPPRPTWSESANQSPPLASAGQQSPSFGKFRPPLMHSYIISWYGVCRPQDRCNSDGKTAKCMHLVRGWTEMQQSFKPT